MVRIMASFLARSTTPSVLQPFARLFGRKETMLVLRGRSSKTLQIFCHACALMHYWAGLYGEMDKVHLVEGDNLMLASQSTEQGARLQLTDGLPQEPEDDSA